MQELASHVLHLQGLWSTPEAQGKAEVFIGFYSVNMEKTCCVKLLSLIQSGIQVECSRCAQKQRTAWCSCLCEVLKAHKCSGSFHIILSIILSITRPSGHKVGIYDEFLQ